MNGGVITNLANLRVAVVEEFHQLESVSMCTQGEGGMRTSSSSVGILGVV